MRTPPDYLPNQKGAFSIGDSGRVGRRRAAYRTFPAPPHRTGRAVFPHPALRSSSSGGFAPQAFQVAHLAHHLVEPTSVMEKVIPPSFLGSPPGTLVLTP